MSQPKTAGKRLHLVFGPGGVRVISCAGVLVGLHEQGYEFASAAGCSAGALVAALVAGGMESHQIVEKLLEIDLVKAAGKRRFPPISTYPIASLIPPEFSLYKKSGFPKAFCKMIGGDRELRQLKLPFATAAIDINNLETLYYTSQSHGGMRLSEALELAVAVPGLFPAIRRESRMIVDGAFATQLNLSLSTIKDPSDIPVVMTCHIHSSGGSPKSLHEYLARSIEASVAVHDKFVFGEASVEEGCLRAKLLPNLWWINIACPDISYDKFDLSLKEKEVLLAAGRDALRHSRFPTPQQSSRRSTASLPADTKAAEFGRGILNQFYGQIGHFEQKIDMRDSSSKVEIHGHGNITASGSQVRADHNQTRPQIGENAGILSRDIVPRLSHLTKLLSEHHFKEISKSCSLEGATLMSKLEEAIEGGEAVDKDLAVESWKAWLNRLEADSKRAIALAADITTLGIPIAKLLFNMVP